MSYRYMRMIVMFDLPVLTAKQRKDYAAFRKYLVKSGFIMMQESIYTKIVANAVGVETVTNALSKNSPPEGIVQVLSITEKQFAKIEYIVGEFKSDTLTTDERLVIL
ncbi:CRISPR-associated endonuclease Cas2 [Butyrivibrio sp. YAB3001]|uniref:CRISPR-associated endonuclease Cas2 n=1 Tax=Butyrivibrio sp. YAB3001 TaxID=1520812 RepID=UPI0008F62E15|nr:CRISPR-associated endonuclease Cas2 [Butyrivibrio sp. YAB3001]SFB70222.1 CRISPR-associated protein Cas2 [Butyrivibrio sp. YAB3001]